MTFTNYKLKFHMYVKGIHMKLRLKFHMRKVSHEITNYTGERISHEITSSGGAADLETVDGR
jgi:hypothetical protein